SPSNTIPGPRKKCPNSNRNHCPIWIGIAVRNESESVSELNWNRCPNSPGIRTNVVAGHYDSAKVWFESSFTAAAGSYQFAGDVFLRPRLGGSSPLIDNSYHDPNYVFQGNVIFH